ncbi:long-chain fatty acid--CoA ligase [Halobacteriales archaeon QS_1_68_20]|nr:MAG: long-chain fatty acid--CoA ligase [Halobacteriales archaeon QS_1_68_20]
MAWEQTERAFEHELLREETLPRAFERSAAQRPAETAQMYKGGIYDRSLAPGVVPEAPAGDYAELTYGEMRETVHNLTAGFRDVGLSAGDRVGIFADTRMEWALSDWATLAAGGVVTTVYEGSSPSQVQYLLGDSGATGVVVENGDLLERVFEVEDALNLQFVVVMDEVDVDRDDVYTLAEIHDLGAGAFDRETYESWIDDLDYDDLATLVYTSGTTGRPKGVKLTHRNVRSNLNQSFRRFGPRPDKGDLPVVDEDSTLLSYLPLAHILERTAGHFLPFGVGATVAYAESPDTLQEDLQTVQPTGMVNVPRIFERIYDGMREQASESALKLRIFEWAMDVAREYHRTDRPGPVTRLKHRLADLLVYRQIREGMGGNVEFLNSGGGTLSEDVARLFQGMGFTILEGYGMTEASPVVTANPAENPKPGTIGPPLPGIEVDVDVTVVPEGGLAGTLGEAGELLVRGENVFEGYWNKPGETEAAFTNGPAGDGGDDRWFRTGDVVTIRPDGYLVFHERAKQLMVLSTGKNVAPGPIEEAFADEDLIEQVMVVGDDRKFVAALVVPNVRELRQWAERAGVDLPDDPGAVCENDRVRARVEEVVAAVNAHFESHEQIGDFRLIPEEFTEDDDLLTPTLKKKRRNIRERYAEEIESIYATDSRETVAGE